MSSDAQSKSATSPDSAGEASAPVVESKDTQSQELSGAKRMLSSAVAVRLLLAIAIAVAATFGLLWKKESDKVSTMQSEQSAINQAEEVAGGYAVAASTFDSQNLDPWRKALQTNVTDQLRGKFDSAVEALTPLLQQLQWQSSSTLVAAKVSHHEGDQYVVQAFVDMKTKSSQFPDGLNSTATYSITLDKATNWTVTDVGGIGAGLPADGATAPPAAPGSAAPGPAPAPGG